MRTVTTTPHPVRHLTDRDTHIGSRLASSWARLRVGGFPSHHRDRIKFVLE
jgi:hypothetical protein